MELGLSTFADTTPDPRTGTTISSQQRLADLLEEASLADQLGLDVFGVGEHHRKDYAVAAPAVVLAAIAARTKRIRLTSAVSVLSSDDPVRLFQQFATLDLLSNGRAEIMAGRGSFIESFPLFGYDLGEYDSLFEEKLELLLELRAHERVTWSGRNRAPLADQLIHPRPLQDPLPVWIAVGGTPASVVRAARLGLPVVFAIIGGEPERFAPLVEYYREAARRALRDPATLPVGINTHAFVADTSQEARERFFPGYAEVMTRIGRERGWPGMTRAQFDGACSPRGALAVGSPQEVIDKILLEHSFFGHRRYLAQMAVGAQPHQQMMRSIELYGTVVAPAVRKALGVGAAGPATAPGAAAGP